MVVKPRIAVFLPTLDGGGAERAMVLFARTAQELGCAVDLVCAEKRGVLVPLIDWRLPVIDLQAPGMWKTVSGLRQYLKQHKPDAVFSTMARANLALIMASRGMRDEIKVVLRESNAPVSELKKTFTRKIGQRLKPIFYRRAHRVIAVSEVIRSELVQRSRALAPVTVLARTPIVPANFISQAAAEPGHSWFAPGEPPVVLGVGRLHRQKNFALLIRAFAAARAERPCRLIILGQGPLQNELQELSRSLGIAEHVSFAGFSMNPFSYMSRARVFVLSSDYEGMPNVLIQAMALSTPVIATDCPGGAAEVLEGGKWGTLVPVGDVEQMSQAILGALDSPRREDSAELVAQRFGAEQITREYLEIAGIRPATPTVPADLQAA